MSLRVTPVRSTPRAATVVVTNATAAAKVVEPPAFDGRLPGESLGEGVVAVVEGEGEDVADRRRLARCASSAGARGQPAWTRCDSGARVAVMPALASARHEGRAGRRLGVRAGPA